MRKLTHVTRFALCVAGVFLFAGIAPAGEKKLMHCFAFTPIETATDAEWQAFYKATDQLPKKVPGISHVWYGKLRAPLNVSNGQGTKLTRKYGVCMEMANEDTLKSYVANPFHKEWMEVYSKVRVEGTTTYDIIGQ
jgi:Stress responsive A/B Barrel Domain